MRGTWARPDGQGRADCRSGTHYSFDLRFAGYPNDGPSQLTVMRNLQRQPTCVYLYRPAHHCFTSSPHLGYYCPQVSAREKCRSVHSSSTMSDGLVATLSPSSRSVTSSAAEVTCLNATDVVYSATVSVGTFLDEVVHYLCLQGCSGKRCSTHPCFD